jgi:hypothetical protein
MDNCRCVQGQIGNRTKLPAILVASRPVEQQVANGEQIQSRQLCGTLRANAVKRSQRYQQR